MKKSTTVLKTADKKIGDERLLFIDQLKNEDLDLGDELSYGHET